MPSPSENDRAAAWPTAAHLIARWLERRERIDELLEAEARELHGAERARCQHLVFGVIRHFGRIEAALNRWIAHPPRHLTRAVLLLAGFELIEAAGETADTGLVAKIVHHAVEQAKRLASPAEARLVNAVVRRLTTELATPPPARLAPAEVLAEYFSHPAWLVRSWLAQFGAEATRALLEWNQQPAPVHARWRAAAEPVPDWFKPTPWPGYYELPAGRWTDVDPLLKSGRVYLQDPATRLPVELLAPQPGEFVFDACAAPGGKTLLIADTLQSGRIIALDLPGARSDRLKENLSRAPASVEVALVQGDLQKNVAALLEEHRLPRDYPALLLDVPCSNTGVMRHRVDVKWRLQEGDFRKHPRQQLTLLTAAARLVAPAGRLVYSTCSIDREENEHVVSEFIGNQTGRWKLDRQSVSYPWQTGHDGAAAFLLRRVG